ncbi:hypothetical protein Tco_1108360 [Tanacetum coccineum]
MSNLEDSTVTYTEVSSPFEDLLDIGYLRVDRLPMMLENPYVEAALQDPPSPDYVLGPEYPPSPIDVPYVLEPVYLEFMPPEDDVLPAEEQPLSVSFLPTADSPSYITKSDPEEDPEEDDEDPKEDPANYPNDRDDDEEEESSRDNVNDEEEDEDKDEEEEEEHLAPADSVPPPIHRILSPLPQILSPLLPVSPPPLPASPTYPLGYRAAMIRLRAESPSTSYPLPLPLPIVLPYTRESMAMMRAAAPSTYILASRSKTPPSRTPPLLPIQLPTPSPPLLLPSTISRAGVSEVTLPPRKRLCIALGLRFEVGESSSAPTARPTGGFRSDYGFLALWMMRLGKTLGERQDTNEIYGRLDDAQDDRLLISSQLNMLRKDRPVHACTARLMESESIVDYCISTADQDQGVAGSRPQETNTSHKGTNTTKDTADIDGSATESADICYGANTS